MDCPHCGAHNRAVARYCRACGGQLLPKQGGTTATTEPTPATSPPLAVTRTTTRPTPAWSRRPGVPWAAIGLAVAVVLVALAVGWYTGLSGSSPSNDDKTATAISRVAATLVATFRTGGALPATQAPTMRPTSSPTPRPTFPAAHAPHFAMRDVYNRLAYDVTGDGATEALYLSFSQGCGSCGVSLLTIFSGDTLLFEQQFARPSLAILPAGDGFRVKEPVPLAGEPQCCPSGVRVLTYRWDAGRFVGATTWEDAGELRTEHERYFAERDRTILSESRFDVTGDGVPEYVYYTSVPGGCTNLAAPGCREMIAIFREAVAIFDSLATERRDYPVSASAYPLPDGQSFAIIERGASDDLTITGTYRWDGRSFVLVASDQKTR